jgi:aspartate carbamoyltransferase regulatory subunit
MKKDNKIRKVAAIREGTVLDHLPSNKVLKLLSLLMMESKNPITIGMNLRSNKQQQKGIIKVGGRALTEKEYNKIAILAPEATVNRIEEYEVVEKRKIELRGIESATIRCNNPGCITNYEPVSQRFKLIDKKPLKIRCHYCERMMDKEEIEFL